MARKFIIILISLFFLSLTMTPQNAPITRAGAITDATPGTTVTVPIIVRDFASIGSFTLTLRYRLAKATYLSATSNPALNGLTVTQIIDGNFGYLVITWPQTPGGLTLPDETVLLELEFTYINGTSILSWYYFTPYVCQYQKYSDGSYIPLSDVPKSSYYLTGGISNRTAPVATVGNIANAISGNQYDVPVTVTGFTTIGSMYYYLDFDSDALTYVSTTKNPAFGGSFLASVSTVSGSIKRLTVGWFGSSVTLADGSAVLTVRFTYNNVAGQTNYSVLSFTDNGSSCEYTDASGNVLIDFPQEDFYHDGYIINQEAPTVWLPELTEAPAGTSIEIPLLTRDFSNIHSFNLTFEYDTSAMSYNGFTANASFGGALTVTNTPPVGSKRQVMIHWPGPGPLTLPDSTNLVTLDITSKSAPTPLDWVTDDATSCRFNDILGNAYYDLPKSNHYRNGLLASQYAPMTMAGQTSPTVGQQVTVPVVVYRFANIGTWNLEIDFDPGVLTYQSASLLPAIGGSFSATQLGTGRITMSWTGTATTLPDSTALVELVFNYSSGASLLAWHDDGASCKYAASPTDSALYDLPAAEHYINGYIGPAPMQAVFTASNLLPALDQVITLTDLSTGNPTGWNWIISPSTFVFVNGSSDTARNPQVRFSEGGPYTITLVTTRETLSSARMRPDYIRAGTPGLWTGNSSTDWYTATNWENHMVPDGSINVFIPGSPAGNRFPFVAGDLETTLDCLNIHLEGPAEMTINGALYVETGTQVFITGTNPAKLKFE